MMDLATACFFKRYYPHVIKWWFVVYNPEVYRVWPSPAEREEALRIEAEEERLALEQKEAEVDESAFNATTGSYSGLYGQGPVDEDTQAALDAILNISSNQSSIDSLISGNADLASVYSASSSKNVTLPPEQDTIIQEANAIYERLMREAAEDEARKQAEIEAARQAYNEFPTS